MNIIQTSIMTRSQLEEAFTVSFKSGLTKAQCKARWYTSFFPYAGELLRSIWRQVSSPFILLLLGTALISFFTESVLKALVLIALVLVSVMANALQEYRVYCSLKKFEKYYEHRCKVLRSGQLQIIAPDRLLVGDIIFVGDADVVPADIRLIKGTVLVDESDIRDEPAFLQKNSAQMAGPVTQETVLTNTLLQGSFIMRGDAEGIVVATGTHTYHDGHSYSQKNYLGHFEEFLTTLTSKLILILIITMPLIVLGHLLFMRDTVSFVDFLLFGSALLIGIAPDALPAILSVSLIRGAHLLQRQGIVVKKLFTIDDLGSLKKLCIELSEMPDAQVPIDMAQDLGLDLVIFTDKDDEVVKDWPQRKIQVVHAHEYALMNKNALPEGILLCVNFSAQQRKELIEWMAKSSMVGYVSSIATHIAALKVADVALVDQEASDRLKDSADVLVHNGSLENILTGIRIGRQAISTTYAYLGISLGSSFGNYYSMALMALFFRFLPMLPAQIVLLDLLSDAPLVALAGDTVPYQEVKRRWQLTIAGLFRYAGIVAFVSFFFDMVFLYFFYAHEAASFQTSWFILSVVTEIVLIISLRTQRWFFHASRLSSHVLFIMGAVVGIALILPYTAVGKKFFLFVPLSPADILTILLITVTYLFVMDGIKVAVL